jgi:hypothetical protein
MLYFFNTKVSFFRIQSYANYNANYIKHGKDNLNKNLKKMN